MGKREMTTKVLLANPSADRIKAEQEMHDRIVAERRRRQELEQVDDVAIDKTPAPDPVRDMMQEATDALALAIVEERTRRLALEAKTPEGDAAARIMAERARRRAVEAGINEEPAAEVNDAEPPKPDVGADDVVQDDASDANDDGAADA